MINFDFSTIVLILFTPLILQLIGLFCSVMVDSYLQQYHKQILLIIALLQFLLIGQNIADYMLTCSLFIGKPEYWRPCVEAH